MTNIHHASRGAKRDAASGPPIGCTSAPHPAVFAKLSVAALHYSIQHPGAPPTRDEGCLSAGAMTITAENRGFGFLDVAVFEHPGGWGTALTYKTGVDWTTAGLAFTADDLRNSMILGLSGSAALTLFRGRDLLAGNVGLIGIACTAQRYAESVDCSFAAALRDALTSTARILQFQRSRIEQAAALIERDGPVTRDTPGLATLLAAARATPITAMPPALEQASKLARSIGTCRMDLSALAHEVSQVAQEPRT